MSSKLRRIIICLFRNDLRIHDNEALLWAHQNSDHLVPLYCFDPDHFKGTWHFNFAKTGIHRTKFIIESIKDLKENLQKVNSDLVIEHCTPLDAIKNIVERCKRQNAVINAVVFQKEITYEELNVEKLIKEFCQSQDIKVKEIAFSSLCHEQDVKFRNGSAPDSYTQFRKEVEGGVKIRSMQRMPDALKSLPSELLPCYGNVPDVEKLLGEDPAGHATADERTAFPFKGGETAGLNRLRYYLWESDCVAKYKETRNGLVGDDYSTKFSPWLSLGCLSPRKIYWEIKKYEETQVANQSTYWVIFELLWRDYFKFVCQKYGDRVFYLTGILDKNQPWSNDKDKFQAWAEGRTGVPFVDANMRELKETGWMSNRGRQNVASFLIKDLGIDWRMGAEWFESQLLDHDVCSNYGNWNYAAGIGNDPRENRKFNMVKQAMDYDAEGDFVRLWVKELRGLKGAKVHVPWIVPKHELEKANIDLGVNYPKPMVLPPEWSRHTKTKMQPNKGQRGIDFYFKSPNNTDGSGKKYKGKRLQ